MSALDDVVLAVREGITQDNYEGWKKVEDARFELAQLRADLHAARERIAQLDKMIALNRYITPPFDLIDDATAQLAIECSEKDDRIAEQARQLEGARTILQFIGKHDYPNGTLRNAASNWLAANPAPEAEPQSGCSPPPTNPHAAEARAAMREAIRPLKCRRCLSAKATRNGIFCDRCRKAIRQERRNKMIKRAIK